MQINHNLKCLIFYFFLLGLTGCNGVAKVRLDCLSEAVIDPEQPKVQTDPSLYATEAKRQPKEVSIGAGPSTALLPVSDDNYLMQLWLKAAIAKADKQVATCFKRLCVCVLDFQYNPKGYDIHQLAVHYVWLSINKLFDAYLKNLAADCRQWACQYFFDPELFHRLFAPVETANRASGARVDMHNKLNLAKFCAFCHKTCLANFDSYIAGLFWYVLNQVLAFQNHAHEVNYIDIHQYMASFGVDVFNIGTKVILKNQIAKLRQGLWTYFMDPDSRNKLIADFQAISNEFYTIVGNIGEGIGSTACAVCDAAKWSVTTLCSSININVVFLLLTGISLRTLTIQ